MPYPKVIDPLRGETHITSVQLYNDQIKYVRENLGEKLSVYLRKVIDEDMRKKNIVPQHIFLSKGFNR